MSVSNYRNEFLSKASTFGHLFHKWTFLLAVAYLSVGPRQSMSHESATMSRVTFCMTYGHFINHYEGLEYETDKWHKSAKDNVARLPTKDQLLKGKWGTEMIYDACLVIRHFTDIEQRSDSSDLSKELAFSSDLNKRLDGLPNYWLNEIKKRGVSYEEFVQKAGTELLHMSLKKFEQFIGGKKVSTHIKIASMDSDELCFQPDYLKPVMNQDMSLSMTLDHNPHRKYDPSTECLSVKFHKRTNLIQDHALKRDSYDKLLCFGKVHKLEAEGQISHMKPGKGAACHDYKGPLDSELNCRSRCRLHTVQNMCSCSAVSLSFLASAEELKKYPLCGFAKSITKKSDPSSEVNCMKKCYPDCTQIRYTVKHQEHKGNKDLTTVDLKWKVVSSR